MTAMNNNFLVSCSAFQALILRGVTTVPTIGSNTFQSTNIAYGTAYVYVPRSLEAMLMCLKEATPNRIKTAIPAIP